MRVKDALTNQHRAVISLADCNTVADAIDKLRSTGASALIVTKGARPTGIFTSSDIIRAGVESSDKPIADIPLKEAMTAELISVETEDNIAGAIEAMLRAGIHHMPVNEDGQIIAILPVNDLAAQHIENLESEIDHLNEYIHQLHDALHD